MVNKLTVQQQQQQQHLIGAVKWMQEFFMKVKSLRTPTPSQKKFGFFWGTFSHGSPV